jgi:hypothetical protein
MIFFGFCQFFISFLPVVARLRSVFGTVLLATAGLSGLLHAQVPNPAPQTSAPVSSVNTPRWNGLTTTQKKSLAPLAKTWDTLSDGHRRKWIALSLTYPSLAPAEQEKLHSRMAEWAALKPKDRELARLNFVETKKIAPENRAANWEAYQALSAEERGKLASGAPGKPSGAAIAIKPVSGKMTPVPATSNAPEAARPLVSGLKGIDPQTLLPLRTPAPAKAD